MKMSTRSRYGTRALLDIAGYGKENLVPLKDIARRQQLSLSYLEHLIGPLIEGGIIRSVRGVGGGITLAKDPDDIQLGTVIGLLEGSLSPVRCVENPDLCTRAEFCAMRDIWDEVNQAISGVLNKTTLQDLIERQELKGPPEELVCPVETER